MHKKRKVKVGMRNLQLLSEPFSTTATASIFNGEIDEVRIWGIDRSQIDIENSMHGKLHGFERGLMGSWSFDECAGLKTRDVQGRRDAQLHGGRWVRSSLVLFSHQDEERAV